MSRACGNGPSKSSPAKPATAMSGRYSSSLDYVLECQRTYREVCRVFGQFPNYRSHWQRWEKNRPFLRTRTSGLVGPEPDISARESDIPRKLVWELVRRSGLPTHYFQSQPHLGNNVIVANHNCIGSFGWTDEQVKKWTLLANAYGVEYHGKRGYKTAHVQFDVGLSFFQKKALGVIPSHRRSDPAKIRRAARRGVREALIQPQSVSSLFTTRYRLSARECRERWYRFPVRLRFSEFKASFVPKGVCLSAKHYRGEIPLIVYRAIDKLYSEPVMVPKPWFQGQGSDCSYTIPVKQVPKPAHIPPRILRPGAAVQVYNDDLELESIARSTIPRFNVSDISHYIDSDNMRTVSSSLRGSTLLRELDLSHW